MTNKTTKRALFTSVMSLIICVVMLMGTTFAWFTDSVVSGKNKIVAGNLDVELYYQNDTVPTWTKVGADTNVFKTGTLWEPGHTEVVKLKIVNEGTLALKYLLNLAVVSEVGGVNVDGNKFELSDYIKYGTTTDAVTSRADAIAKVEAGAQALSTETTQGGTLLSKNEKEITLVVYMPETVGNEANYRGDAIPTIDFGVELLATQVENESDSFGIDYDKNAIFYDARVTTDAELLAAIQDANVKVIAVDGDLTYDWGGDSYANSKALLLKGKTVIGFDGNDSINFAGYGSANPIKDVTIKNITVKDSTVGDNENSWEHGYLEFEGLTADDVVFASSIMLDGTSVITNSSIDNTVPSWYGAWVNGGNATFKNCSFTGTRAIKLHEHYGSDVVNVTVDGCTFVLSEKPGVVIGTVDADTTVDIKNSTFINCQAGDQGLYIYETDTDVATFNFTEDNNTVLNNATYVSTKDELRNYSAKALTGNNGTPEEATIVLDADIDMQGAEFSSIIAQRGDKLTIVGNGHKISNVKVVSGVNDNTTGQASMFYAYPNSTLVVSNLTLENITVAAEANDTGYAAAVVGYCEGAAELNNVDVVNATITGVKSSGMLVGHLSGSLVAKDCDLSGTVTLADFAGEPNGHYAGKYIGTLAGAATLTDCTASVTVSGNLKAGNIGDVYGRKTAAGSLN